ncbi:MAG: site-2 protease family protein [Promethearchaeota archaeon]
MLFNFIADFFLNPWFLISLAFWIFISILVLLLRNKKEAYSIFFPFLALFKTKKLNKFIVSISRRKPKFWRIFWNIGIFVSFGFTIYGFFFFFTNIVNLIFAPSIENAIIPLIPGVTIDLPVFFYMLLPLLLILTTHEFAHGISGAVDGVEIKSTGVLGVALFYLVGFGAFVEVDERSLNSTKHHRNTRLRIAAAGTYINAIVAGIALLLLIIFPMLTSPFFSQVSQINFVLSPEEGGFNDGILTYGDAIVAIKKEGELDSQYVYLDNFQGIDLSSILDNQTRVKCSVGDNLTLKIYNPFSDLSSEKEIVLGPRYNLSIEYEYTSDYEIKITYNYTSHQQTDILINYINGTAINRTSGNTLEKYLTQFDLKTLDLNSTTNQRYLIEPEVVGVFVGVQTLLFWMHKNDFAKFLSANWPDFWLKEISWLFIIGFSLTLFNMMPLPIFDGDRVMKEIVNSIFGSSFSSKKRKLDRFLYKIDDPDCKLSEYRIETIDEVKILIKDNNSKENESEIILGKENYELIDSIGDGFNDAVKIHLPTTTTIKKNTIFEISFEYWYDEKIKIKKIVLNTIRAIALILMVSNFALSFIKFGFNLFWL